MGPSSLAGFSVFGVGPSLVLDEILSYKKTLYFYSTHYRFVIGEVGIGVINVHLVALTAQQRLVFLFRAHRYSSLCG
jgi:hypothetical protein